MSNFSVASFRPIWRTFPPIPTRIVLEKVDTRYYHEKNDEDTLYQARNCDPFTSPHFVGLAKPHSTKNCRG